jgi:hypothetical protein
MSASISRCFHALIYHKWSKDGGGTIYIHTAVLTNYTTNANDSIRQATGSIQHIRQGLCRAELALISYANFFFEESWTELVMAMAPYNMEMIERTTNAVYSIFSTENSVSEPQCHL